jgi:predicted phosphodiesterase
MRILVFSDVHGNLPAFEKMVKQEKGIDLYLSLGDVVNYGPWSDECVDLLESLEAIRLIGNHEVAFMEGKYPGDNPLVQKFFNFCYDGFNRLDQISRYEPFYEDVHYRFQHTVSDLKLMPDSDLSSISGNYFIGHSHYQFDRIDQNCHVINVGSVGQNRREINVINYAVYESEQCKVMLKEVIYDIQGLLQKMKELHYPEECINYYLKKPVRKNQA